MILHVHQTTPERRSIDRILRELEQGKVLILPTDTVYALVGRLDAPKAIKEIYRIRNLPEKKPLSLLCRDIGMLSHYAKNISNPVFRFMRSVLPGPYTFILNANRNVDKRGIGKKREVGVRIVGHPLHRALMQELEIPLIATSVTSDDEYLTDPEELDRQYGHQVAFVVDGGHRYHEFSTILDCTEERVRVIREGKGEIRQMGLDHLLDWPEEASVERA